jgi:two-component system response regulator FixJ
VVDDDEAVRDSVAFLLRSAQIEVETYESAVAFLGKAAGATGCVLTDVRMPEMSGIELMRRLKELAIKLPVIVMTGHGDVPLAVEAMKAGAVDFIEKPFEEGVLVTSVERAIERDRQQRARRDESDVYAARLELLTPRERQVLRHVIAGRLNKQIAARLGTAEKTIKVHRARVMYKMSVRSVAELTRVADFIGIQPEA